MTLAVEELLMLMLKSGLVMGNILGNILGSTMPYFYS